MQTFELDTQLRTERGKAENRRLRRAGYVPAVMYGAGKEPIALSLSHNELLKRLENKSFFSRILTVNINNQAEKAVLKDLQRHPYRPLILHMDLQRISETEKLQMLMPLHFINEDKCVGVKQNAGVISHHENEVEIRCLPKDLPESIEVDLEAIDINQILHLSNLVLPENVELVALGQGKTGPDLPVVSVHLARGTKTADELAKEENTE
ncbi:MAG: 50S ribosomal protein L25/general stress protein Ctc [Candidatus Parabeggiatoa sp.]|nr:50S ribosomal protein L25/general stress protein Ctc [Candidatus Parabeggiatoa sp.]